MATPIGQNSYNEERQNKVVIKHIFFPSPAGFALEITVALAILFVLNLNNVGSTLLKDTQSDSNPVAFGKQLFLEFYRSISHNSVVEQISLFTLWALVGMLSYILLFRAIQATLNVTYSVKEGVEAVQAEHRQGFFKWLKSLNDFFVKASLVGVSLLFFLLGTSLCFGVANGSLTRGLVTSSPENLLLLFSSVLWAYLAVRIIVIGLNLSVPSFRRLYNA